jgi:hypothetical protein
MIHSRGRLENVVHAVVDALGINTETLNEDQFAAAAQAVQRALTPRGTGYLSCDEKHLRVHLMRPTSPGQESESAATVKTMDELREWCIKWDVDNFMCSSSMDFPEEYTDDGSIIALCNTIRNHE